MTASAFGRLLVLVTHASDPRPAFRRALGIAQATGAAIMLFDVADTAASGWPTWLDQAIADRVSYVGRERRQARLDALRAEAEANGVPVSVRVEDGVPFRTVVEVTRREPFDLVLKTVDEREPGDLATNGPLDRHLLRHCAVPLWLEQPDRPGAVRRILAAVNPDPDAPEDRALAVDLLRSAAALATIHGAELHVIHAWLVPGEWAFRGTPDPEPGLVPPPAEVEARHAAWLEEAIADAGLDGVGLQRHLVHGRASRAIIGAVREQDPDLLVLGTVGRTGVPGLLIGNTAERVLAEVRCAVLARKPAGFRAQSSD